MRATYSRIRDEEEQKRGLIIVKALYGKIPDEAKLEVIGEGEDVDQSEDREYIDVTIPLQCLVKDSKLVLHDQSKVNTSNSIFH